MRTNFIIRHFDIGSIIGAAGAATGMNPISAGLAGVQAAMGIIQTISGKSQMKKLMAQRTAYKTPEEYFKILRAAQAAAQQGYDPVTLDFLTNQVDRGFDSSAGAALRLGGNPNDMSALFDQRMQAMMRIGAENHDKNMENFSRYLSALDVVGQNKAAEWKSQQDIIKDKMQAAGAEMQAGVQNIGSAANTFISADAAARTSQLYKNDIFKQLADALLSKGSGIAPASLGSMARTTTATGIGAGTSPAMSIVI